MFLMWTQMKREWLSSRKLLLLKWAHSWTDTSTLSRPTGALVQLTHLTTGVGIYSVQQTSYVCTGPAVGNVVTSIRWTHIISVCRLLTLGRSNRINKSLEMRVLQKLNNTMLTDTSVIFVLNYFLVLILVRVSEICFSFQSFFFSFSFTVYFRLSPCF